MAIRPAARIFCGVAQEFYFRLVGSGPVGRGFTSIQTRSVQTEDGFNRNPARNWPSLGILRWNKLPSTDRARRVLVQTQTKTTRDLQILHSTVSTNQYAHRDLPLQLLFSRIVGIHRIRANPAYHLRDGSRLRQSFFPSAAKVTGRVAL